MNAPAALPRSLVPLDDESLPGYLLRLSYRLEIPPARLADLTELTRTSERISVRHLVQLASAATRALARVCSISQDFLEAVRRPVSFLNDTGNQTDYEHRRGHLRAWRIPEADWQLITDEVERHLTARGTGRAAWNVARYLAATVVIWARVADSEPRYAPALARARQAGKVPSLTNLLIRTLLSPEDSPRTQYADRLGSVLSDYASDLAASIDAAAPNRPLPATGDARIANPAQLEPSGLDLAR